MRYQIVLLPFFAFAAACGAPEPSAKSTDNATVAASSTPVSAGVPESDVQERSVVSGYRHNAARTFFPLRGNVVESDERGLHKITALDGVFAVDRANGATYAIPNADAEVARVPALTRNPSEHNARVLEYFRQSGVPGEQIAGSHVTTIMRAHGRVGEQDPKPEFVAFTTVVTRAIDGIAVPQSYAWARLNDRSEVVAESVYWPEIPKAVVAEAKRLSLRVADPIELGRLRAQIGISEGDVSVAIHHAGAAESKAIAEAVAAVDITRSVQGATTVRRFRASGEEIRTIEETTSDVK